jgi:putative nucleotidyltransferase with HDIG domain
MAIPQSLLDRVDRLDPLPVTIHRLMELLSDDGAAPREIAAVVEHDQALVATVLKMANSAAMGSRVQVTRIADAVLRMGVDQILEIALGVRLRDLADDVELYDLTEDELWLHGAVSSAAAREIQAACSTVRIPPDARVAALTHDIGKVILVRHVEADMTEVLRLAGRNGMTFVDAERELFGFDHAEVGGAMARRWGFPEGVADAIARHHTVDPGDPSPTLDAVVLANVVAKTVGVGLGAEGLNLEMDPGTPQRLGFRFEDFARIVSRTATATQELMSAYGLDPGLRRSA